MEKAQALCAGELVIFRKSAPFPGHAQVAGVMVL